MSSWPLSVGCCVGGDPEEIAALHATDADYVELPVARALMATDSAFETLAARLAAAKLPVLAANVFLPPHLMVVGPAADPELLAAYTSSAVERAERLGIQVLVFGSGASRTAPAELSRERALDQLEAFLRRVQSEAERRGMALAIEPLESEVTNLLNTVRGTAAFVRERNLAGVGVVADLWHMERGGEDLEALTDAADLLRHAHVAAAGRLPPAQAEDGIEDFLRRLLELGYRGACSIECRWRDFAAEAPAAVARLRSAASAAGWERPPGRPQR